MDYLADPQYLRLHRVRSKPNFLGHLNFRMSRARTYMSLFTFAQTTYLTIVNGISLWWLLIFAGLMLALLWIDAKYVYPGEASIGTSENPEWKKLMQILEEIRNK